MFYSSHEYRGSLPPPLLRRWLHVRRDPRFFLGVELAVLALAVVTAATTWLLVERGSGSDRPLSPAFVALTMVANLVPLMALIVLVARRVALRRAGRTGAGGNGRLRVRLVAVFSLIASVPTLLVVIFASLLFQYGVEFWFSDKARVVLENSERVSQAYVEDNKARVGADVQFMASDVRDALSRTTVDDPRFSPYFAAQMVFRNLNEAAIISFDKRGKPRLIAGANLDKRPLEARVPAELTAGAGTRPQVMVKARDRVEALSRLDPRGDAYLYVSRKVDPKVLAAVARSRTALSDYHRLVERTRSLQLRFNALLIVVSLLIVGIAVVIAFVVADRLVRPVGDLVDAARRVASGDLSARVKNPRARDEVGTLAVAFNRMTRRLAEQTGALVSANSQLDSRRALIEAVLSGVTAGVLSIDETRRVRLLNLSAERLLNRSRDEAVGQPLALVAPELDRLLDDPRRAEAVVQLSSGGEPLTLAAKVVASDQGHVLTFDDITGQLADQRRAAWADVARRIAHEIKNPLTPIQLAAERLQRRWGREIEGEAGVVFERLTGTIVRQVGDLRRMVDEFSSFARMPKPEFKPEQLAEIARGVLFLHEVAHPAIAFTFDAPDDLPPLVCDRRQLGQALTNCVKNAVEAVEARQERGDARPGMVELAIHPEGQRLVLCVADNGIGLPPERERLTEPYMTTRARGTGLGLAIVSKIVEEHLGSIAFLDREGGGTVVRIALDPAQLAPLASGDPLPEADAQGASLPSRKVG